MNFDELKEAWQRENAAAHMPVDAAVLAEVRAGSRRFSRMILWRDLREGCGAILVAAVFGKVAMSAAAEGSPAWPAWAAAVLPLGVAAFMLVDRWLGRARSAPRGDSLRAELERAADAVRHQIWMLRNVVWWYLLPLGACVLLLAAQVILYAPPTMPAVLKWITGLLVVFPTGLVYRWIWRLNQNAVRTQLQPRLAELERNLGDLEAGT